MSHHNVASTLPTFGLDLGDRTSDLASLEEDRVVHEVLPTTTVAMRERFEGLPRSRVVLEAGSQCHWVAWLLGDLGHEALVAHPRHLRAVLRAGQKTDRSDSEWLLRFGSADLGLLTPVQVRSRRQQADLALLRARTLLMRLRVQAIQVVRGLCKTFGVRLPACSTNAFVGRVTDAIPTDLRSSCQPLLAQIRSLTQELARVDRRIERLRVTRYPETESLMQIQTIGSLTALTFVLTLQDPGRLAVSRQVGPFVGLVPRKRASGDRDPELGITKTGNVELRRLLVLRANFLLSSRGEDCDLKRWGLQLVARGGKNAKKRAIVAVARRLAVLMHRLWVTAEVYEPLRLANLRAA